FFVLSPDEVLRILAQLGHSIRDRKAFLRKNYEYYEQRTTHGSTLSKVVHAAVSKDMSTAEGMWRWFHEVLESDIHDTQGGTTIEGIHSGVMAGSIKIITRVFGGVDFFEGSIGIRPTLPAHWTRLSFKLLLRDRRYSFEITPAEIGVGVDIEGDNPVSVRMRK
ncbi:MAG: beta-phosphoglucomutase, partial [Chitinivibrionales bacterium]|nr:beta-phosphoglucomutase [Chitinivibrionales bacterium]MBD3395423.1 beta-phosphoglucomutase [Chitinivibrionales bacterium]